GWLQRAWSWSQRRRALSAVGGGLLVVAALAGYFAYTASTSREELAQAHLEDAVDDALATTMSGDSAAAEESIARIAGAAADTGWIPAVRGHLAFQGGEYDAAARQLQDAVARLPDSVAARSLLAAAYVATGWWEKYEDALEELEKLTPESAEDFLFRGLAESY